MDPSCPSCLFLKEKKSNLRSLRYCSKPHGVKQRVGSELRLDFEVHPFWFTPNYEFSLNVVERFLETVTFRERTYKETNVTTG